MAADVAHHFAATGGVADHGDALEIERLYQLRQVIGVAIHVVAGRGLRRTAVSAAVVRDDAKAVARQEMHLPVPGVRVERPAVRKGDDRAVAPVLVVDLRAVLGGDGVVGHRCAPVGLGAAFWGAACKR
ncbi:hypothetical protein D3C85_1244160 [compost metagenome]